MKFLHPLDVFIDTLCLHGKFLFHLKMVHNLFWRLRVILKKTECFNRYIMTSDCEIYYQY